MKPALLLLLFGCSPEEPVVPGPPSEPGAVLLVDGLSLTAGEIGPLCADILALYPEFSAVHARRLALTNEFLQRLAAQAREPQGWERARAECANAGARLATLVPRSEEGTFAGLGVSLWSAARHLPIGEWSAPVELAGRWLRLRLDERIERVDAREERLRISLFEFSYLDPVAIEEAIDHARLTILDPEFAEAVPEAWKHRMRADKP